MADAKQSAIKETFEDPKTGRLDFLNARTIAYSVPGEMDVVAKCVAEAQESKSARSAEARLRSALAAGVGLWIMAKYREAAEALAPVAKEADGAYFLGLCLIELGETDAAIKSLQQAAHAGQDAFVCGIAQADALRRAGRLDEALAKIKSLQKGHEQKAELHYQLGRCLEERTGFEKAVESYERAVELDPQHAGALFRLGFWNDLRGNDEQALDYYEKAAAVRPVYANVLLNLGLMYEDRGEYPKAAVLFDRLRTALPMDERIKMFSKDVTASLDMFYDEAMERRQHRTAALLRVPLSEFELSARSRACLEKMNVRTLGDLARLSENEVANSKNFGDTSLSELRALLESKGLQFGLGRTDQASAPVALGAPGQGDVLDKRVGELDLSVRSLKCIRSLGCETLADLVQHSDKELLECPNFGQTSLTEVKHKLESYGLTLKGRD